MSPMRRTSLDVIVFASVCLVFWAGMARAQTPAAGGLGLEEYRQQRREAAHRQRRLIFNNDGGDARIGQDWKDNFAEQLLAARTTPLADSQVTSIFYDTTAGTFGAYAHRTKVGEIFTQREGRYRFNVTPTLIEQGTDPLQVNIDFARAHGKEIFWVKRMNDTHDATNPLIFGRFKQDHPELLFGKPEDHFHNGRWSAVDFGSDEIREMAVRLIEEVAANYDVDGIELNFFRHEALFRKFAKGEALDQSDRDKMTRMMRDIRARTDEIGRRRGRPLLLSLQIHDSVDYCRLLGIDLEQWMADRLFDLFMPSNYYRLNDWEYSVALGRKYDMPVYASLAESRIRDGGSRLRDSPDHVKSYRGRALQAWNAGVDGIYLFNYFDPHSPLWNELGDPETLRRLDRIYHVNARDGRPRDGHRKREVLSPEQPIPIAAGETARIGIILGEDLGEAQAQGLLKRVTCRLWLKNLTDPDDVAVRFNDRELAGAAWSQEWLSLPLDPSLAHRGRNEVVVAVKNSAQTAVDWRDLEVLIEAAPR